jgi:general secretion pathway protein A
LLPLSRNEVRQYVQHRLHLCGGNGHPAFTRPAFWRLYHYTKGIPRVLNALCDKALLAGFVAQRKLIDFRLISRAVRELEGNIHA